MAEGSQQLDEWRKSFFETIQSEEFATDLRDSSLAGKLGDWTKSLTGAVTATCKTYGWLAAGKGHPLDVMPEKNHEYLGIDVMAFPNAERSWLFPVAAFELENSRRDDRIAYSLWKVINVGAKLRVVFCYRPDVEQGTALVRSLSKTVVQAMDLGDRMRLLGDVAVVVGYRNQAETFPYGFFKWWRLNCNIGEFEQC